MIVEFQITMSADLQTLTIGPVSFARSGPGIYTGQAPIITSSGVVMMDSTYRVESPQLIRGEHRDTSGGCVVTVYEDLHKRS